MAAGIGGHPSLCVNYNLSDDNPAFLLGAGVIVGALGTRCIYGRVLVSLS